MLLLFGRRDRDRGREPKSFDSGGIAGRILGPFERSQPIPTILPRQFDEKFDAGEDESGEIDWEKARVPISRSSASMSLFRPGQSKRSTARPGASA